jgi:hypothetical protein
MVARAIAVVNGASPQRGWHPSVEMLFVHAVRNTSLFCAVL